MKEIKLLIKSVKSSLGLVYSTSGFLFIPYLILNFVSVSFPLITSFILKNILDTLTDEKASIRNLILYVSLYILSILAMYSFQSIMSIMYNYIFEKALHEYDLKIARKMNELPISFIDTSKGKDLIDEAKYAKTTLVYMMLRFITVLSEINSFIIAIYALLKFNYIFSLLFLIVVIPGVIMNIYFEKKTDKLRRLTAPDVRKFSYYRWMLTDPWPAKDVRMYDLTDPIKKRYDEEKNKYRAANKKLDKKKFTASMAMELLKRSGEIVFIFYVIYMAFAGKITVGDIALYVGFSHTATDLFQDMATIFVYAIKISTERMNYYYKFMDLKHTDKNEGKRKLEGFESLVFDNVFFKYPFTDKYVLEGVSFEIKKGDRLSIVGVNGAGKTTIIKLILLLYPVDSGQILLNGHPVSEYKSEDVRKIFSVLFQNFVQYPLSLRDNVALSDLERRNNDQEIMEALKKSGLLNNADFINSKNLDRFMTRQFDDKGIELSKGQWQSLALARTYFKDASVIIFDEPSAALDAEAEERIFRNYEKVARDKTAIMISHRISSAKLSNKIIVIDGGKIVENGTHDELIALNGLYFRLYNLQKEKYTVGEVV